MSWGALLQAFVGDDPMVALIAWPTLFAAWWFAGVGFYRAHKRRDAMRRRP